jgi:nucleotide-binding universal stress UspA family protein
MLDIQPAEYARPAPAPRPTSWKRILIPLDGSEAAACPLEGAQRILQQEGVVVTLLRVIACHERCANDLAYRMDARHAAARDDLTRRRMRLLGASVIVRAQLRFGDPAMEIAREITDGEHDLVIMSARAGRPPGPGPIGGVADRVLRLSPVPLIFFYPGARFDAAPLDRLLVVLDDPEMALETLGLAEEVARTFDSKVCVLGAGQSQEHFKELGRSLASSGILARVHTGTGLVAEQALDLMRRGEIDSIALMTRPGAAMPVLIRESAVPVVVLRKRERRPSSSLRPARRQVWVE